ncbi:hypothetical protein ACJ73_07735 [Blastomyces percursus]|uniref:Uncharacterized protein n=1 Tax=Blastomyces percursus TaxID=1658174 RepID=A0A1J9PX52_9EURO|nr:hypothetical protein ACJ73_07735 [Blastomyces percursus]
MFIAFSPFDIMAISISIGEKAAAADRVQTNNDALLLLGQFTTTPTRSTKRNRQRRKQNLRRRGSPIPPFPSLSHTEEQQPSPGWRTAIQNRFHAISRSKGRYYALYD